MPFKKGQSGNPGGRPKKLLPDGRSLVEIAMGYTVDALNTLADIMRDDEAPPAARATAANSLLDRAHGKPKQPIESDLDISKLTHEQVIALALALGADSAAVEGLGGDRAPPRPH
jgi:hypothetical protein